MACAPRTLFYGRVYRHIASRPGRGLFLVGAERRLSVLLNETPCLAQSGPVGAVGAQSAGSDPTRAPRPTLWLGRGTWHIVAFESRGAAAAASDFFSAIIFEINLENFNSCYEHLNDISRETFLELFVGSCFLRLFSLEHLYA